MRTGYYTAMPRLCRCSLPHDSRHTNCSPKRIFDMTTAMVFTFIGADKPGLVQKLAQTVGDHGGNWLESRMSELAGQFAGIVQVAVDQAQLPALRAALLALSGSELTVV